MANTYIQIHIQAVFAVQNRECIITDRWRNELYKYSRHCNIAELIVRRKGFLVEDEVCIGIHLVIM